MHKLTITARLWVAILFFLAPLGVALLFYYQSITGDIRFAEQEKLGTEYLRPLVKMLDATGQLTGIKHRIDGGEEGLTDDAQLAMRNVTQALEELRVMDGDNGAALQFTDEALKGRGRESASLAQISADWQTVSTNVRALKIDGLQQLTNDVQMAIAHVGETSNLMFDAHPESHDTASAVLQWLPAALTHLAESGSAGLNALSGDALAKARLESQADRLKEDGARVQAALRSKNGDARLMDYVRANDALMVMYRGIVRGTDVTRESLIEQAAATDKAAYGLWAASADALEAALQKRTESLTIDRTLMLCNFAMALLLACWLAWRIGDRIRASLQSLETAVQEIADGTLDYPVPCLELKDEVGGMARAIEALRETVVGVRGMEDSQRAVQQQKQVRQRHVEQLITQFDSKVSGLLREVASAVDSMQRSAEQLSGTATQASDRTTVAKSATAETSGAVAAISSAAEQLTAAVGEIAQLVLRSSRITQAAVDKTRVADDTVQQLSGAAHQIGEVITAINGIASKINMLALNATIESARAGEAGKGFAVVASEVKTLANQTSRATETIAGQVRQVQQVVGNVVEALTHIRGAIDEMNGVSSNIAAAVAEQGAATREIARHLQRTSERVQQASGSMNEVGHMADSTNTGAKSVLNYVRLVSSQSRSLQKEVENFLRGISKS